MKNSKEVNDQMKSSKHDLIEKFCEENEVEIMHLQLYLSVKGIVCRTEDEDKDN